jgi:predicted transcriptional regulator
MEICLIQNTILSVINHQTILLVSYNDDSLNDELEIQLQMNSLSFPNYGSDNAEGKIENINHIELVYMS